MLLWLRWLLHHVLMPRLHLLHLLRRHSWRIERLLIILIGRSSCLLRLLLLLHHSKLCHLLGGVLLLRLLLLRPSLRCLLRLCHLPLGLTILIRHHRYSTCLRWSTICGCFALRFLRPRRGRWSFNARGAPLLGLWLCSNFGCFWLYIRWYRRRRAGHGRRRHRRRSCCRFFIFLAAS